MQQFLNEVNALYIVFRQLLVQFFLFPHRYAQGLIGVVIADIEATKGWSAYCDQPISNHYLVISIAVAFIQPPSLLTPRKYLVKANCFLPLPPAPSAPLALSFTPPTHLPSLSFDCRAKMKTTLKFVVRCIVDKHHRSFSAFCLLHRLPSRGVSRMMFLLDWEDFNFQCSGQRVSILRVRVLGYTYIFDVSPGETRMQIYCTSIEEVNN